MLVRLLICSCLLLLPACSDATSPSADVPSRFLDPQGDTVAVANPTVRATDVIATQVTVFPDTILLRLEFAEAVTPWSQDQPTGLDGFLDIDVDRNAGTGIPGAADAHGGDARLGAEWFVDFRDDGVGHVDLVRTTSTRPRLAIPISYLGSVVEVRVPRAVIGESDGRFWLALVTETRDRPVSDFAPNTGHYTVAPR